MSSKSVEDALARIRSRLERDPRATRDKPTSWPAPAASGVLEDVCSAEECCIANDAHGLPQFHLCAQCNPRLTCSNCRGTGNFVQVNPVTLVEEVVPGGCPCVQKERRVRLLNQAQMPSRYLSARLTVPQELGGKDEFSRLYRQKIHECETFTQRLELESEPEDAYFLLMYGPVGVGKTHLACAIMYTAIMAHGLQGRFIEFQKLLFELRNAYAQGKSEEDILAPLRETDLLIIDELGKARSENEWQMERLDDLVNARYNAGRRTIFTTNFAPLKAHMSHFGEHGMKSAPSSEGFWSQTLADRIGLRIYDRIMEVAQVIDFSSLPSLRKIHAGQLLGRLRKQQSRDQNEP